LSNLELPFHLPRRNRLKLTIPILGVKINNFAFSAPNSTKISCAGNSILTERRLLRRQSARLYAEKTVPPKRI